MRPSVPSPVLLADVEEDEGHCDGAVDAAADTPPPSAAEGDEGRGVSAASAPEVDERFWNDIAQDFLLPFALRVAGCCHLLHSVSQEAFEGLVGWDRFWESLTVLDRLLMIHFRRERVVALCCDDQDDKE